MPGSGIKLVTGTNTRAGVDSTLATAIGSPSDPNPSFAISVRADPNNGSSLAINVGRRSAFEPFYADDSRTYYSCRREELVINDNGNSGLILYVDDSGPMDPLAQYATVVMAQPIRIEGVKAPNDPTP